ncbi:MAG TPA: hypothetical protein VGY55_22630 [Pirellulales bacterium]|nr:hypothetical protein [Pirellulales bacterium]
MAILVAPIAFWHRERQNELAIIEAWQADGVVTAVNSVWLPPDWLPDSIADVIRPLFDRVDSVKLEAKDFTEITLAPLQRLGHLTNLELSRGEVSDAGFRPLGRLSGLKVLSLLEAPVNDEELERLAGLSQLEDLRLDNSTITDAGLASLSRMHNLHNLSLGTPNLRGDGLAQLRNIRSLEKLLIRSPALSDKAVQLVEQFKSLEELVLINTSIRSIRLEGLPNLRSIYLATNPLLASIDLDALPVLQEVQIDYDVSQIGPTANPALHLDGASMLKTVNLSGVVLNPTEIDAVLHLHYLSDLSFQNVRFPGGGSLKLESLPFLASLEFDNSNVSAIQVVDAPLESLTCVGNPNLESVRLERLPKLINVELTDSPHLTEIDLRQSNIRDELRVGPADDARPLASRNVELRIRGLGGPGRVMIRHAGPITADSLANLSRIPHLVSLGLGSECLHDDDLSCLSRLTDLEQLDLSNCNVGGEGLLHLRSLPALVHLYLERTPVSDEAVIEFQRAKPNVAVSYEPKKPAIDDLRQQVALVRNRLSTNIACKHQPEKLADRDFECLAALDCLTSLDLSGTHLTDAGLENLRRLPRLHDLVLRRTQVTDAAVRLLRQIPELQHVDIEETRITDDGRRALGSLVAKPIGDATVN